MTESQKVRQYTLELLDTQGEIGATVNWLKREMMLINYDPALVESELDTLAALKVVRRVTDSLGLVRWQITPKGQAYLRHDS
ncbi:MAG: hypothetical protein RR250_02865 [Akkermansia sp.]